jgi:hypothetical protein
LRGRPSAERFELAPAHQHRLADHARMAGDLVGTAPRRRDEAVEL